MGAAVAAGSWDSGFVVLTGMFDAVFFHVEGTLHPVGSLVFRLP